MVPLRLDLMAALWVPWLALFSQFLEGGNRTLAKQNRGLEPRNWEEKGTTLDTGARARAGPSFLSCEL